MRIGIIGPTGFSGSHTALELLNRGHEVVGLSRHPERLGTHERYTPIPLAIETAPMENLVAALKDLDVLINAYNPGPGPNVYSTSVLTSPSLKSSEDTNTCVRNLPRNKPPPPPRRQTHHRHPQTRTEQQRQTVPTPHLHRRYRLPLPPRRTLHHSRRLTPLLARLPPRHR